MFSPVMGRERGGRGRRCRARVRREGDRGGSGCDTERQRGDARETKKGGGMKGRNKRERERDVVRRAREKEREAAPFILPNQQIRAHKRHLG